MLTIEFGGVREILARDLLLLIKEPSSTTSDISTRYIIRQLERIEWYPGDSTTEI